MEFQDQKFEFIGKYIRLVDENIITKLEKLLQSEIEKAINSRLDPLDYNITEGFTEEEEEYAIQRFTNYVTQTINNIQRTTFDLAEKNTHPTLRDYYIKAVNMNASMFDDEVKEEFATVRNLSIDWYKIQVGRRLPKLTLEQKAYNTKVIAELRKSDSVLWEKVRNRVKYQYGYVINEKSNFNNTNNELPINWYGIKQFEIDPLVELSSRIKMQINGTVVVVPENYTLNDNWNKIYIQDADTLGGLPVTLDYRIVLPCLMEHLSDSTDIEDMMKRFEKMCEIHQPILFCLFNRLEQSENLKDLFFSHFSKYAITSFSNKVNLKFETEFYNKPSTSQYWMANKWIRKIKSNIKQGKYSESFMNKQLSLVSMLSNNCIESLGRIKKVALIYEIFNNIGIEVYYESILYVIDNPKNRDFIRIPVNLILQMKINPKFKYLGLTIEEYEFNYIDNEIIAYNFIKPLAYICESLKLANSIYEKTGFTKFDQHGSVNRLAKLLGLM